MKLALVNRLHQNGVGPFDLADCKVKSNWLSNTSACGKDGAFRNALRPEDIEDIAGAYFRTGGGAQSGHFGIGD